MFSPVCQECQCQLGVVTASLHSHSYCISLPLPGDLFQSEGLFHEMVEDLTWIRWIRIKMSTLPMTLWCTWKLMVAFGELDQ